MRVRQAVITILLGLSVLWPETGWAECMTSNNSGSLGSVPSTQTGQAYQTRVAGGLSCRGTSLQLQGSALARATITGTTHNFALVNGGDDRIAYGVYTDAAFSNQLQTNAQHDFVAGAAGLTAVFSGPDNNVPLYIRTSPVRQLSAGTYRDTISLQWSYNQCIQLNLLGLCLARGGERNTTVFVELTMEITRDCLINAPDISFGSAPLVSGFGEINQSLSLFCTKGSSFQVGLGPGRNARSGERHMISSNGELLRYRILKPGGTPWRDIGSGQARSHLDADLNPGLGLGGGPGVGGSQAQGFGYRAVIDSDQPTPSPGTYTDQVVVTVQF